jgi:hypothetical protein
MTKTTGTLQADQYIILIISRSVLLTMRNPAVEEIKAYFYVEKLFFFLKIVTFMRTWKNTVEPDRPQITVWQMSTACWITKATDTHSEYVILRNNGCMQAPQCYKYIASLVVYY